MTIARTLTTALLAAVLLAPVAAFASPAAPAASDMAMPAGFHQVATEKHHTKKHHAKKHHAKKHQGKKHHGKNHVKKDAAGSAAPTASEMEAAPETGMPVTQ